eukprot:jgi/Botrbrau1/17541/Bobra.0725s0002.1
MGRPERLSESGGHVKGPLTSSQNDVYRYLGKAFGKASISVQVKNGSIYDGCLTSASSLAEDPTSLGFSLSCATLSTDEDGKKCTSSRERYQTCIFKNRDWVRLTAVNIPNNLDAGETHTANGGLATDSDISRGRGGQMRPLTKWEPPPDMEFISGGLEDEGSSQGWDQFHHNEIKFGVITTFDENQYTTKLDPEKSKVSKEEVDRLVQLVQSAPSTSTTSAHLAEERGQEVPEMDEEDRYAGVIRKAPVPPTTAPTTFTGRSSGSDFSSKGDRNGTSVSKTGPSSLAQTQRGSGSNLEVPKLLPPPTRPKTDAVKIPTPQGLSTFKGPGKRSPYGTPKNKSAMDALNLDPGTAKFPKEVYRDFMHHKENLAVEEAKVRKLDLMKEQQKGKLKPAMNRGGMEDPKVVWSAGDPSKASTSQSTGFSMQPPKGGNAVADYRPSGNIPPSEGIMTAAGGAAAPSPGPQTTPGPRAPVPAAPAAQSIPPLAPKPVLPGQADLPVKSKLNPNAKEWKPSAAPSSAGSAEAKPAVAPPVPPPRTGVANVHAPPPVVVHGPLPGAGPVPGMVAHGMPGPPYGPMTPVGAPYVSPIPVSSTPPPHLVGSGYMGNMPSNRGMATQDTPNPSWAPPRTSMPGHNSGKGREREAAKQSPGQGFDSHQTYSQSPGGMPISVIQQGPGWYTQPQMVSPSGYPTIMIPGSPGQGQMMMRPGFPPGAMPPAYNIMPYGSGQFMPYGPPGAGGPRGQPYMAMSPPGGPHFVPLAAMNPGMAMPPMQLESGQPRMDQARMDRNHNKHSN